MYELWRFTLIQGEKKLENLQFDEAERFCNEMTPLFRVTAKWIDEKGAYEVKGPFTEAESSLSDWIDKFARDGHSSSDSGINISINKS